MRRIEFERQLGVRQADQFVIIAADHNGFCGSRHRCRKWRDGH
jgi:hypothetical protein